MSSLVPGQSQEPSATSGGVLHELLEEFQRLMSSGNDISAEEFASEHPEHRVELLQILPIADVLLDMSSEVTNDKIAKDYEPPTKTLGDYRIVREIGRGGMGIVYEAHQISLDRRVALKILPLACLLGERQIQRFHNEARAAASLRHPNIVGVHGVGCERSVHFYSMELVKGCDLSSLIQDVHGESYDDGSQSSRSAESDTRPIAALSTQRQSSREEFYRSVARLGVQAAEALHHAHEHGVIHRDVKPANLLVDASGNVRVTDFGLAQIQAGGDLSKTGDLIGTLRYMSPEQIRGEHVDARTDVFSLGVTLYELCVGKPAFGSDSRQQLMETIVSREAKSLRLHDPGIPADLQTIIDKAIAKDPVERYGDAARLAADLERFLGHHTIEARPASIWTRFSRFARRNPSLTMLLATTTLLFAFLSVGAAAVAWKTANEAAIQARESALREYASDILLVQHSIDNGNFLEAERLLLQSVPAESREARAPASEDLRGFEWFHLWARCHSDTILRTFEHPLSSHDAAFSPDGTRLADAWLNGKVAIWNLNASENSPPEHELETNSMSVRIAATFAHRLVLVDKNCSVFVHDWGDLAGEPLAFQVGTNFSEACDIHSIDVDPSGRWLAAGGDRTTDQVGFVEIWDIVNRKLLFNDYHLAGAAYVSFSADGKLAVVCRDSSNALVYSVEQGTDITEMERVAEIELGGTASHATRSHDRSQLAIGMTRERGGSKDTWVELRDFNRLEKPQHLFNLPSVNVHSMGFSHSDDRLSVGDRIGNLWTSRLKSGHVSRLRIHDGHIRSITYSHDDSQVVTASNDRHTHFLPANWDEMTNDRNGIQRVPTATGSFANRSACFLNDRQLAVTRNTDGIDVYDLETLEQVESKSWDFDTGVYPKITTSTPHGPLVTVEWKPDPATHRIEGGWKFQVHTITGKPLFEHSIPGGFFAPDYSISSDGKYFVSANAQRVALVDLRNGDAPVRYIPFNDGALATTFSPDSCMLVCGESNGWIHCLDVKTLKPTRTPFLIGDAFPYSMDWIPGTRRIALAGFDRNIKIVDVDSGKLVRESARYPCFLNQVKVSPDGQRIGVADMGGKYRLLRTEDLAELLSFSVLSNYPLAEFSPNGESLLVQSWDELFIIRGVRGNLQALSVAELRDLACTNRRTIE